jgi:polysaccharide chain length determinant protein (PEP-CTERM system associated)
MKESVEYLFDEVRSAWRFRWIALAVAAVVAVAGWAVVFALPDRYEAKAAIFVDTRTALKPVLQGLTMEQDVNTQLNYVRQSLFAGNQLERIARESGVLPVEVRDPRKMADLLADFSKRFVLDVKSASGRDNERDSAGSIYSFSYQDENRTRGLKVIDTVLNAFIKETLGGKREGAENAQKFLETQLKTYEERLRTAESKLADFKKANVGLMPAEQGGYFGQLQVEIDAARKAENDLNVAVARRAEIARQLRGDSVVTATAMAPPAVGGGQAGGDTVSRIKDAQAKLDELLLRFTDKHPDVMAARATLAELQSRRTQEVESLRRGDTNAVASSGASSNPVYQTIQLQLNQADVEIASLRGQLGQHRAKAAELKQRLDVAPQVEAQYSQLNRDYEVNKTQYTAMLANYEKARLGEQADSAGSVRFEIVQPPLAPYVPVSPLRWALISGVMVAALALGGALAYLLHLLAPVIGSAANLQRLTELPLLGVVSTAFPAVHRREAGRELRHFLTVASGLVGLFAVVLLLNLANLRLSLPLRLLGIG